MPTGDQSDLKDTSRHEAGWSSDQKNAGGPKLAVGGIVTRPTKALIGEAGPEAVIPLNQIRQVMADLGKSSGGGGGTTVVVQGSIIDLEGLFQAVGKGQVQLDRRGRQRVLGRS